MRNEARKIVATGGMRARVNSFKRAKNTEVNRLNCD